MGKKTDKFSTELRNLLADCAAPAHEIHVLGKKMDRIHVGLTKLEKMHNQRVKEIDPGATTQFEKQIAADRTIRAIDAKTDELNNLLMDLMLKKREAKKTLKTTGTKVAKKAAEFRRFLEKKAKSRNPFKSKKSLPGALKFLDTVDGFVDDIARMVR